MFWSFVRDNPLTKLQNFFKTIRGSPDAYIFFKQKAERLINEILEGYGFNCKFDFRILTAQSLFEQNIDFYGLNFMDALAYGTNKPLRVQMEQYNKTTQR